MTNSDSPKRSIITSASSKFFPSLLNLIGSIKKNYPDHPPIYVYNLGLFPTYKAELKSIEGVSLVEMPRFCSFWRKCYTWKTYIFKHPFTSTTLYLDAGNEVLKPLNPLFDQIERNGYLAVQQGIESKAIIPEDYVSLFGIDKEILGKKVITAGIFGFDTTSALVKKIIADLHDASLAGLCLGYSRTELWKNKHPNNNFFVRNCAHFRHDTTLLTILLYARIPNLISEDEYKFGAQRGEHNKADQIIHNLRMNYDTLHNIRRSVLKPKAVLAAQANRFLINGFFVLKRANKAVKGILLNRNIFSPIFGENLNIVMDSFHEYPGGPEKLFSNVRLYHHQKAYICSKFIEKEASASGAFLDAGAGTGPYSRIASPLYGKVYAYEYNEAELEKARENLKSSRNIEFGEVDLRKIPLEDESIDVFICSEVLEHIQDEELAAKELFRILKPGGKALISMPNKNSIFYRKIARMTQDLVLKKSSGEELSYGEWERIRHISFGSADIEKIVTDAGFRITKRHGANLIPLPTPIRKFLMTKMPALFYIWAILERNLSKLAPSSCSFYFVEIEK